MSAKYIAGAVIAVFLTVLFQAVSLGTIWLKGGLLGGSQPVSVLEELGLCPWSITVWQYALLDLACKMFSAVMLSMILNTVSALSKSSVIAYGACALVLGGCLWPVYDPPRSELLAGPLALSNPLRFFDSYYTANIASFPVLWSVVQVILWLAVSVGLMLLANKAFHKRDRVI